jgi:hypothetical protein
MLQEIPFVWNFQNRLFQIADQWLPEVGFREDWEVTVSWGFLLG